MRTFTGNAQLSLRSAGAVLAAAGMLAIVGCSDSDGDPVPVATQTGAAGSTSTGATGTDTASSGDCATPTVPMIDLKKQASGEPGISVPTPSGWERETSMDSQMVRAAVASRALVADRFAPNAVIVLESTPNDVDAMFTAQEAGLARAGGDVTKKSEGTQCGFRTLTVTYTARAQGSTPERTAEARVIAVPDGSKLYAVTITVQTTRPDDPTYRKDSATILDQLQVTAG